MERLVAIVGPTAVGKTKLSIDLAKLLNGEIISGDSMLLYKGMNIGTAKPSTEERSGIVHHLIDILEPDDEFSVVDFKELADKCISEINERGKKPVLAGGTGLYVKSLLEDYNFDLTPEDPEFRTQMHHLAEESGREYVHAMLAKMDAKAAEKLHPNDLKRVIRALEVYRRTGQSIMMRNVNSPDHLRYDAVVIGLIMERNQLYERINQRVDAMMSAGLIDEVAGLLERGITRECQSMQAIGYKEIAAYLKGEIGLDTAIANIKQATRHFAKRQMTWYRKMPYIVWFDVNQCGGYNSMLATFYNMIAGNFSIK